MRTINNLFIKVLIVILISLLFITPIKTVRAAETNPAEEMTEEQKETIVREAINSNKKVSAVVGETNLSEAEIRNIGLRIYNSDNTIKNLLIQRLTDYIDSNKSMAIILERICIPESTIQAKIQEINREDSANIEIIKRMVMENASIDEMQEETGLTVNEIERLIKKIAPEGEDEDFIGEMNRISEQLRLEQEEEERKRRESEETARRNAEEGVAEAGRASIKDADGFPSYTGSGPKYGGSAILNYTVLTSNIRLWCNAHGWPLPSDDVKTEKYFAYIINSVSLLNEEKDTHGMLFSSPQILNYLFDANSYSIANFGTRGDWVPITTDSYKKIAEVAGTNSSFNENIKDDEGIKSGYIKRQFTKTLQLETATLDEFKRTSGPTAGNPAQTYIIWKDPIGYSDGYWRAQWWEQQGSGTISDPNGAIFVEYMNELHKSGFIHEWVDAGEIKTVYENDGSMTVGPFKINYLDYKTSDERLAGITEMKVYSDVISYPSESTEMEKCLVPTDNWEIVKCANKDTTGKFPAPNTEFYIKVKGIKATEITNIHFDFKYTDAESEYSLYSCPSGYKTYRYKIQGVEIKRYDYSLNPDYIPSIDPPEKKYDYTRELEEAILDKYIYALIAIVKGDTNRHSGHFMHKEEEEVPAKDAQILAAGESVKVWTNTESLDYEEETKNKGEISISKVIVDENGNELSLADLGLNKNNAPEFKFKITVNGSLNDGTETITVKAGSTENSSTYKWKRDTHPTFRVEEVSIPEGYELKNISLKYSPTTHTVSWNSSSKVITGTFPTMGNEVVLEDGNSVPSMTIHLKAVNKKTPKMGKLKIVKQFDDNVMPSGITNQPLLKAINDEIEVLKNKKYPFIVNIVGNFEYKNGNTWEKKNSLELLAEASVNEPWILENIRWYGEEPPNYIVKEANDSNDNAVIDSITPNNGTDLKTAEGIFVEYKTDSDICNVTAKNKIKLSSAKMKIIKKVDFTDTINEILNSQTTLNNEDKAKLKEKLKNAYTENVRKHIFNFSLEVENYYGFDSGNLPQYIAVPGETGEWIEENNRIYFTITKLIDEDFYWIKGKQGPKYILTEKDDDLTTFKEFKVNGATDVNINNDNKRVEGILKEGNNGAVGEIENIAINNADDTDPSRKINLYKVIENIEDLGSGKDFKFKVILKGKAFTYDGKAYVTDDPQKDIEVQLTNTSSADIVNGQYDDTKFVQIRVDPSNLTGEWISKSIKWNKFVKAPEYSVEEYLSGEEYEEQIINGKNNVGELITKRELIESINNIKTKLGTPEANSIGARYLVALDKIIEDINRNISDDDSHVNTTYVIAKNVIEAHEGKLGILKILDGQTVLTEDDIANLEFSFKIQIGNDPEYVVTLSKENGNLHRINEDYVWTYESSRITWGENEEAPEYTVEEINLKDGAQFESILEKPYKNATTEGMKITGQVSEDIIDNSELAEFSDEYKYIDVTNLINVENSIGPKSDTISLKKIIEGTDEELNVLRNNSHNPYKFKVRINGKFEYDGGKYDGTYYFTNSGINSGEGVVEISIPNTSTSETWNSNKITWEGNAPTVEITEENLPDDVECEYANGKKSAILGASNGSFTVKNRIKSKKASLHIIKTLKNDAGLTEEQINKLYFKFKVTVEDNSQYQGTLIQLGPGGGRKNENGDYVWEKTLNDISWYGKDQISYSIVEQDVPGVVFVSSKNATTSDGGKQLQGYLKDNGNGSGVFDAEYTNKSYFEDAKLTLNKIVENYNGVATYNFKVKIKGEFSYKGNSYNTGGSWYTFNTEKELFENESGTVTIQASGGISSKWEVDSIKLIEGKGIPEYRIEEQIGPEATYKCKIENQEGLLSGKAVVTATNTYPVPVKIKIVKDTIGISSLTEEQKNQLVFDFSLKIGDEVKYDSSNPLHIRRNASGIWVYEETFNTDDLNFEVEEIGQSGGVNTTFVRASSTNGIVNGKKISGKLSSGESKNIFSFTNSISNNPNPHKGQLAIDKRITSNSLEGKEFKFKVTLEGKFDYPGKDTPTSEYTTYTLPELITVRAGEPPVYIEEVKWYGSAPLYYVEEVDDGKSETIGKRVFSGRLTTDTTVGNTIVVTNDKEEDCGYLKIDKKILNGQISGNEKYYFKVDVEGYEPYFVTIDAKGSWTSQEYKWDKNKPAPKYTITEVKIPEGSRYVSLKDKNEADRMIENRGSENASNHSYSGKLIKGQTITLECNNSLVKHEGIFKVKKTVVHDKEVNSAGKSFKINVVISGTFSINDELIKNGTKTLNIQLQDGGVYTSSKITWYGENAPEIIVSENLDIYGSDRGWRLQGIANNNVKLKEGETPVITVTNYMPRREKLDLTLELAGVVWEDEYKGKSNEADGLKSKGEKTINGVEVYVYKKYNDGTKELATIYDDGNGKIVDQPIITGYNGKWDAPRIKLMKDGKADTNYLDEYSFDVEFNYDGQTYEPTKFLALTQDSINSFSNSSGYNGYANWLDTNANINRKAGLYKNQTINDRDKYAISSMAVDYNRKEVDDRIKNIYGYTSIDGNGKTIGRVQGKINGVDNTREYVYYKSDNVGNNSGKRAVSKLITLNSDGTAKDLFKAKARTSAGGLTYCFDKSIAISDRNITIASDGITATTRATATYNYTKHINLGLRKRDVSDIEVQKDLIDAQVIVNDKRASYKFKGQDTLSSETGINTIDSESLTYKLGLYKTDFYYRAEIYKTSMNYNEINKFYKNIYEEGIDETNFEIYLTYRIAIYNGSAEIYKVKINSINDYYESSLQLVDKEVKKYIETDDGKDVDRLETVAVKPYYEKGGTKKDLVFTEAEKGINSSDGITYNKLKSNIDIELESGNTGYITLTMKADVNTIEEVATALDKYELRNNQKSNIVEIDNYSVLYTNGVNAGKIDRDSAPDNIDIKNHNIKTWYEEDTDEAPRLELGFIEKDKEVRGTVWEDNPEEGSYGKYDEGNEAVIGGLTTQLVEKVKIKDGNTYTDYDFLWPTNIQLDSLQGRTIEYLTGFSSTIETSRKNTEKQKVGEYLFTGVPTGNHIVRYLYGINKLSLENTTKNTGNPVALKRADESVFSGNSKILTANYDEDFVGKTPAVYNGQDYQATVYKAGQTGLITNEWETDLEQVERLSDARDNEARRLEVIANSQTITNVNGLVMGSANNINVSHDELFDNYYMYADTAKLNLNYDSLAGALSRDGDKDSNKRKTYYTNVNSVTVNIDHEEYSVTNIDFGLVERPETTLVLDKQIANIKVTTSDKKEIFDAIYNVDYKILENNAINKIKDKNIALAKVGKNHYLIAEIKLDEENSKGIEQLQAINKIENKTKEELKKPAYSGVQNFRYINMEEELLQGCTIEIKYNINAINVSELDYVHEKLDTIEQDGGKIKSSERIKSDIIELAKKAKEEAYKSSREEIIGANSYKIGTYIGEYYYRHARGADDKVVTTRVRQLIDYVDNDLTFKAENNQSSNESWRTTTMVELAGNGYEQNRLLSLPTIQSFNIVDKYGKNYITDENNNIVLSIDDLNAGSEKLNNEFESKLYPYSSNDEKYKTEMKLTVTKVVSAQDQADNLAFDNVTEILKYENSAGRRNVTAVPGDVDPKKGEFIQKINDNESEILDIDSSATELITFVPPTGIEEESVLITQMAIVAVIGMIVLAGGIIYIKKKVLK